MIPKVFISYSRESESLDSFVLGLANRLNEQGVDCDIDQYVENPIEGWQKWMLNKIEKSDHVLILCTKSYLEKIHKTEGKGVKFESLISFVELYNNNSINEKFIPIIHHKDSVKYIPSPFLAFTFYDLSDNKGYEKLYRRITNQVKVSKPNLGEMRKYHDSTQNDNKLSETQEKSTVQSPKEVSVDDKLLRIELKLNKEIDSFNEYELEKLNAAIKKILETDNDLIISQIRKGSVIIRYEMTAADCEKLLWAAKSGKLDEFGFINAEIVDLSTLAENIVNLTVREVNALYDLFNKEYLSDSSELPDQEKVRLKSILSLINELRGIGLKEAKEFVVKAPVPIKKGVSKADELRLKKELDGLYEDTKHKLNDLIINGL
jgi:hypothetical protein